jgi:hypothetical protein
MYRGNPHNFEHASHVTAVGEAFRVVTTDDVTGFTNTIVLDAPTHLCSCLRRSFMISPRMPMDFRLHVEEAPARLCV